MTAISISFALKPRREDDPYKIFLYGQFFEFAFVTEFLYAVDFEFEASVTVRICVRSLIWCALLAFGTISRSHVAKLTDKDLSSFLINDVVMGGVIIGIGQLAFLIFASIQVRTKKSISIADQ